MVKHMRWPDWLGLAGWAVFLFVVLIPTVAPRIIPATSGIFHISDQVAP